MSNFKEYNQKQGIMKVIIPEELLEDDHPARIIDKIVETLDLSEIYKDYAEEGNEAYHPRMMLKVLFYAYYKGLMSGRKIWEELKIRADFIFLSGDQIPDFRTINRFRTRHIEALSGLFTQVVMICVKLGMVGFEHLAIDGEKIQANASLQKFMDKEGLEKAYVRAKEGIRKLLEQEPDDALTEKKRKERIQSLDKKIQGLDKFRSRLEGLEGTKKVNMTDPEAPVMKHKDRHNDASYNHQSAVDGKYGVTTAITTKESGDKPGDLYKLVDKSNKNTMGKHKNVMADSSFWSYDIVQKAAEERMENILVPDRRFKSSTRGKTMTGLYDRSRFEICEGGARCPQGKMLELIEVRQGKEGQKLRIYAGKECPGCIKKGECTRAEVRKITIDSRNEYLNIMRDKLRIGPDRENYKRRQGIIEPAHGNDQKNRGWIQHHLRGKLKAGLEFMLVRMAANLAKIIKYRPRELLAMST